THPYLSEDLSSHEEGRSRDRRGTLAPPSPGKQTRRGGERLRARKKVLGAIALGSILAIVAAACSKSTPSTTASSGGASPKAGGVYRSAIEDFGFTNGFDPTGEYLGTAFGLYSQLLIRNLVSYNHVEGSAGDQIFPDLATDTGTVSNNGTTYTFHLKPGVMFG